MKCSFFQAVVVLILLYGCTTWTLTKRLEKKLDGNYTRMLQAILNKSWRQHPTKHQLYGHLPPIMKTIQVRQTRHVEHCWRSRDELINDVLLWTPTYGRAKVGRPARTYIQQLCEDIGSSPEDLPEVMNEREKWRERVRDICASCMIWWWWWWVCRLESLTLVWPLVLEKEICYTLLKNWPCVTSCSCGGIGKYIYIGVWGWEESNGLSELLEVDFNEENHYCVLILFQEKTDNFITLFSLRICFAGSLTQGNPIIMTHKLKKKKKRSTMSYQN